MSPADLGPPSTDFQQHGLYVSSSLLFGHFDQSQPVLHQPFASHDHVRVLDVKSPENDDCHEVLDRILNVLNTPGNSYDLINLSIGPELAVDDDEVTVWTASIDDQIAKKAALVTVACGNNGELDAAAGLNRVQAPADAVNVLSVGSADSQGDEWQRAPYSSVGPGRSPGLVKPDGLAFGGTRSSGFNVISSANTAIAEEGTSFAAPSVLRTACGIRAMVEDELDPLTLRALLIEGAECSKAHTSKHVGWGRFPDDPKRIIEGLETQATIVFRGTLPVGEHLRAPLPIPIELEGMVTVSATLVISPEVDPSYPTAYTRAGLEVAFRPHSEKYVVTDGKPGQHPKTKSFFSAKKMYTRGEYELRADGAKWEPCLSASQKMRATSLSNPCFDIYYHHRSSARADSDPKPIPYCLVVRVSAPKVSDFYSQVLTRYRVLAPVRIRQRVYNS